MSRKREWAVGECGRSGQKMLLSKMVYDGYYKGLLVHPKWKENAQQQENLVPIHEETSLEHPMPMNDAFNQIVKVPLFDFDSFTKVTSMVSTSFIGSGVVVTV